MNVAFPDRSLALADVAEVAESATQGARAFRKRCSSNRILTQVIRVKSGRELVNYCYLILNRDTNQAIIIDPAWEIEKIQSVLAARKCELTAVLLTHHHQDHTNLAAKLADLTGADIFMSSREIDFYGFSCANLRPIVDGFVESASMSIRVIDTPGHTAGSVCFSVGESLFTGDTLFVEGCGLCIGPGASPIKLFESLQVLKQAIPDNTKIYPGHRFRQRPGVKFRYVKESNVSMQIHNQNEFVRFHTRKRDYSEIKYI